MLDLILQKLKEAAANKAVFWVLGLLGVGVGGGIGTGVINDPFYHEGWIAAHRAWLLLFVIVSGIGIILCLSRIGFWVVIAVATACAFMFAILYERYEDERLVFAAWILHWIVFALLIGILAHVIEHLYLGVIGTTLRTSTKRLKPANQIAEKLAHKVDGNPVRKTGAAGKRGRKVIPPA